ncbi:glycosyltransferase family 4 protein [Dietzia psychralcaliphila]|uniref:glycosyltransferase family 4 protein n=1 Tax=Dietzia psychralcaliphila TaxID=139021 RepID=UPI001C1E3744|nr:glycosyltransferase family 4 protein [Dietzia psychralcaliphila]
MRIGLVSQWYPPEVPALVPSTWARGLAARGHDVHVITGVPNYPSGRVYDGYAVKPYRKEYDHDVTVHRGFLYPSHDSNPVRRMTNYLSFSAGGTIASMCAPKPDVWLTNGTPATAAVPALLNRSLRRGAHAMVIQDLWPESVTQSGFLGNRAGRVANATLGAYCNAMYRNTDAIGVISPGMRNVLVERGIDPSKIHYTPNSVPDDHLLPDAPSSAVNRTELGLPSGLLFMYAGNLGRMQNLHSLVAAFRGVPEAQLALVGSGVAEPELRELSRGATNITFIERQDLGTIGKYIAASDVQVVSLSDTPLLRVTMPSKFQACLAASRPVLVHAAGDIANIAEHEQVGIHASPTDIASASNSIREFTTMSASTLSAMGKRARALYALTYSPVVGIERLESLISAAVNRRDKRATNTND